MSNSILPLYAVNAMTKIMSQNLILRNVAAPSKIHKRFRLLRLMSDVCCLYELEYINEAKERGDKSIAASTISRVCEDPKWMCGVCRPLVGQLPNGRIC